MDMTLRSTVLPPGGEIPARYTCDGEDVSPPLAWNGVPEGTRSFVLIVDDPDAPDPAAPRTVWVHWVLYDIPARVREIGEGTAPAGARSGLNGWDTPGYRGPCPPVGRHRYFHRLYALDIELGDLGTPSRETLEGAMEGHVLARGELMGTYQRSR
jgi:Raf kinase inhibitor-like YbhB/YbcL family protein